MLIVPSGIPTAYLDNPVSSTGSLHGGRTDKIILVHYSLSFMEKDGMMMGHRFYRVEALVL